MEESNTLVEELRHMKYYDAISSRFGINSMRHFYRLNDTLEFKSFIEIGASVNLPSVCGHGGLHFAASEGRQDIVNTLIEAGAQVDFLSRERATPLHFAAQYGYPEIVKILLQNNANVNSQNKSGEAPLHCAASNGKQEVVGILIEAGADVNISDSKGSTPLHFAVLSGHHRVVNILLQNNANVNSCTKNSLNSLHKASYKGYVEVLKELLAFGAHLNSQVDEKKTALHFAVMNNHLEIVDILLDRGIDFSLQDTSGRTALDYAIALYQNKGADHCAVCFLLMKHILKLKSAEFFVSDHILQSFNKDEELRNFQRVCEQELERLKCEEVSPNLTFFDVLLGRRNPGYARNDSLMQTFASLSFPVYGEHIEKNIKQSRKRIELVDKGQEYLADLFKASDSVSAVLPCGASDFPAELVEEIVSYLSNLELENFICCDIKRN